MFRKTWTSFVVLTLCAAFGEAQVLTMKNLGLDGARLVASAAEAKAKSLGAGSAIAVVDQGGNLLYLARLDGTFAAGSMVSIRGDHPR